MTQPTTAFTLTPAHTAALRSLDLALAEGEPTQHLRLAPELIDHGVVDRDEHGQLEITVKGRRLLREH
ncbi:hypothetical protein AAFF27_20660 [Xylophilus sp. GW821-FHT01B05]